MLQVKVCVGSSCHVRGGAQTLKIFRSLMEANDVSGMIDLCADLCLDNCLRAPNVVVDGTTFGAVTPDRAEKFFLEEILPKVHSYDD